MRTLVFAVLLVAALSLFARNTARLVRALRLGTAENRFDRPGKRLLAVVRVAFGQTKLLREPFAGMLHVLIFWGFVILLTAVIESVLEGLVPGASLGFLGPLYPPLVFLQDLMGALVLAAVVISVIRRLLGTPARLNVTGHAQRDALFVLGLILTVMVTMFGQCATRAALGEGIHNEARVLSSRLAPLLAGIDPATIRLWFHVFFWGHLLAVLAFLNYLPMSKHLHILTSIPNVYFSNLGPKGALAPLNLADDTLTKYGATDVTDLTWKQLLNGYTCTECGRCTSVCPANATGKRLNPKKIITDVRARTFERALGAAAPAAETSPVRQLLDTYTTEQELWACTTCMACVQECPVMIEHIDTIIDLRRGLVLNESRFPDELKTTFANLERNYTPWGFGHATRAEWAEGLGIPLMAEAGKAEYLFWVGCAGAYDARYRKVSRAFATLLQRAGVDFAILGTEEKCNGDPARRMGNEYLAQTLMTENIATLQRYGVRKIVVTCPHCLQSLGKEYRQFGGEFQVMHHTEFLERLVREGRLQVPGAVQSRITFHDPCYLGRYNDQYDAPRRVLASATGSAPQEMPRARDRSFCCGAGGGRMWMEEKEGKRVNTERTQEALATRPETIGTACPFCLTMMTDGVKESHAADAVRVRDVAEILLDALEQEPRADRRTS